MRLKNVSFTSPKAELSWPEKPTQNELAPGKCALQVVVRKKSPSTLWKPEKNSRSWQFLGHSFSQQHGRQLTGQAMWKQSQATFA